ncbi:hypothetical protein NOF04DRAFT_1011218 [Fusarium oxysporum II5]|nr:hypothetical protein NOF04DRAFT_1011218 [Fusarium oxysporum II5]
MMISLLLLFPSRHSTSCHVLLKLPSPKWYERYMSATPIFSWVECLFFGQGKGWRSIPLSYETKGGSKRWCCYVFFLSSVLFLSSSIPELDGVNHVSGLIPIGVLRPGKVRRSEAKRGEIKMKRVIDSSCKKVHACVLGQM